MERRMAEEQPSLHIDTDWKKQAQEEKRRLAEQAAAKKAAPAPAGPAPASSLVGAPSPSAATSPSREARGQRELPSASISTLVQSLMTQTLYYLGDLASRGGEGAINLDMAKHQLDTLSVVEEKTKGNLTPDEQKL